MKNKHFILLVILFSFQACITCPKESFPTLLVHFENQPENTSIHVIRFSSISTDTFQINETPIDLGDYGVTYFIQLYENDTTLIQSDTLDNLSITSSGRCDHLNEVVGFKLNGTSLPGWQAYIVY